MTSILRTILNVAILIVALPIALVVGLLTKAGILSRGRECTPAELASQLKKFAEGTEGPRDWDYFESVPFVDPRLEAIRQEVLALAFPPQSADIAKLHDLAAKVSAL